MNIQIFTRTLNPTLYAISNEFLPKNIERVKCTQFNLWEDASNYLYLILTMGNDWVINLDEDAFVTDWSSIIDIIKFMDENGIEYCGMPDGGVCHHRSNSWIVCNPFFNIFNVRAIRRKLVHRDIINRYPYNPEMEKNKPFFVNNLPQGRMYEPFNSLFYWLADNFKCLYLNALDHPDKISTMLQWKEKAFLYHSWYSREFHFDSKKRQRIFDLYFEAKATCN